MAQDTVSVCYFPGRESAYSRNRVLLRGMREAGIKVYDCSSPQKNFLRYIFSFIRFLRQKRKCDIVFVGFLGQFLMPFVKICTRKKIIFEAFISIYQTSVFDRKIFSQKSLFAHIAKFIDRFSCRLADVILLDTNQHIEYFTNELNLKNKEFVRLLVGSDDTIMYPRNDIPANDFLVHFHGEYQSLHGTEYIIEAANLLPHIRFQMIGKGKNLNDCITKAKVYNLKNVTFLSNVPYEHLPDFMSRASVCLGIFGKTPKTQMVIPHKVYEAMAMGKAVITADTPAIHELLSHKENVYLCQAANPASIAQAIQELYHNQSLREQIARMGKERFQEKCTPKMIGLDLKLVISKLVLT